MPETVGRYELVRKLGMGGMGEVYLAHDPLLERPVAIKVVLPSVAERDEWQQRMLREARVAARLDHPNICTLYEAGIERDSVYLVMQYLDGTTVDERWRERPGDLDEILSIARGVASALAEAHRIGVIHRDIKPQNVMLTSKGVKVLDFGLARLAGAGSDQITQTGVISGTTPYMSPEQLRLELLDGRSDIFSLGAMLYQLMAGRRPFDRRSVVETVAAILHEAPPPLPSAGPRASALDRLVMRMLDKRPAKRPSADDVVLEIETIMRAAADEAATTPTVQLDAAVVRTSTSAFANAEQQKLYSRGRHLLAKRTVQHARQALEVFQELIDLDPECAPGFAGLADCYLFLGFLQALPPNATFPKARAATTRAIALDPGRADAHATLGYIAFLHDWNVVEAERELRLALAIDGSFATAHHWLGIFLTATQRFDEARVELTRARDLDPLSPIFATAVAFPDVYEGRPEIALRVYAEIVELQPSFLPVLYYRGLAFELAGKLDDAIASYERSNELAAVKLESYPAAIRALALRGDVEEAQKRLAILREERATRFVPPLYFAIAHLGLGDEEAVFAALDEAIEQRGVRLSDLHLDRRFDALSDRARFDDVLRRIGIVSARRD